jgi:MoaA/NifB/PqqE/SkfB family radical SAM enzyme
MIICIGDGSSASDIAAQEIAQARNLNYYGVLDANTKIENGVYHTSDADITEYELLNIVDADTEIVELANANQTLLNVGRHFHIKQMLETNHSFCAMGWTSILQDGDHYRFCCHQTSAITVSDEFDYETNKDIKHAQQLMLQGLTVPQCENCIQGEQDGRSSIRKASTRELATLIGATSIEEITNSKPVDYDVRIGNQCNAQCRMCCSEDSRLIDIEYTQLGLQPQELGAIPSTSFDLIDLSTAKRVYVAGGEPAISKEFIIFLQKCIDHGRTDIELRMTTNAYVIPKRFLELLENFTNIEFNISVDGIGELLHYIRYPITWEKLSSNIELLKQYGNISFGHSIQLYNIVGMYDMFEYFDTHYSDQISAVGFVDSPGRFWFGNYPDKQGALEEVQRCKTLNRYADDAAFAKNIDYIEKTLTNTEVDFDVLQEFYDFNDLLDHSRSVYLKDYLPILEAQRRIN